MAQWVTYQNGNYRVCLNLNDGTKIRRTDDDQFRPATIESMDLKITGLCDMGCPMCHENSTPNGKHADLTFKGTFLDKLHPFTEIAIGGGNPLSHPGLLKFLKGCKKRHLIPSLTVHHKHLLQNEKFVQRLIDKKLIYGVGVSWGDYRLRKDGTDPLDQFIRKNYNTIVHVICGMVSLDQLREMAWRGYKILFLGYKTVRRGKQLYDRCPHSILDGIVRLKKYIPNILVGGWFDAVTFDNLALQQLDIRKLLSEKQWNMTYMGDDGMGNQYTSASMYVDLVERQFTINSCAERRYPLRDTIEEMFHELQSRLREFVK